MGKEIAHLLWQKYIKTYAELEINISSRMRSYFFNLMHDKKKWVNEHDMSKQELYELFDNICYELYTWMNRSLSRFLASDDFAVLKMKFNLHNSVSLNHIGPSVSPNPETEQMVT